MTDRMIWCERGWQPVHYGFCPSEAAWTREMRKMGIKPMPGYPETQGCTSYFRTDDGRSVAIVTVSEDAAKHRQKVEIIGILVHEAAHIWQYVRKTIGEAEPGAEMEAYAMQAISQELIAAYGKSRRRLV
ncbi:MAG: hypothetical protein KF895_03035 [Parvibaculum sp.]|nr:hypothetical protein [Parvibaculum sp.]